ncbi:glucose-6-phosphatase 3-like [Dermacentor variabilis]|uniref:glucose-6-phosphatase 3-like n=1 Tax=Dermacentor variabilis TaxID=34621 RepID=UPI003F5B6075
MDAMYTAGAHMTKHLQENFDGYDRFFSWISFAADPPRNVLWYYPIALTFSTPLGIRILIASSCSEFLNVAIKWVLNEHRPFWYVKLKSDMGIQLAQTPQTCETGPGSPSGHVMITAAVLYVVIHYALSCVDKTRHPRRRYLKATAWSAYVCYLTAVGASRVFIGAHFPHQVMLGFAMGVATGYVLERLDIDQWHFPEFASLSGLMAMTCATVFTGFMALGVDPQSTVHLALEACDDPRYVNISSTVLYSMMRNIACPLGVSLAMSRPNFGRVMEGAKRAPVWAKLLAGLAGVGIGRTLLACPLPKWELGIYAGALIQFCFFSFAISYGIPYVLHKNYKQVNKVLATPPKKKDSSSSSSSDEE